MKQKEVLESLEKGTPLVKAEWRSAEAVHLSGTSTAGKKYDFKRLKHNVEIAGKPFEITQDLPDNADVEALNAKPPFLKGTWVIFSLDLRQTDKGVFYISGTPTAYAPNA